MKKVGISYFLVFLLLSFVCPCEAQNTMGPALPAPSLKAGERKVLTVDGIEYAFRWCPPGEFMMGAEPRYETRKVKIQRTWVEWAIGKPDTKTERDLINQDELLHKVKLTKGFWMLETQVTQAMWQSVMGQSIEQQRDKADKSWPLYGKGPNYPMYYVNWDECQEFCLKLSQKLGQQVLLPTEAQWEYACRAGTTSDYAGDLDEMAWYEKNSGGTTHEVAQKKPNAWGFYDMHGNLWEWCADWYDKEFYAKSPECDPENTAESWFRVFRGSCWFYPAESCRSACRCSSAPDLQSAILGFRPVLVSNQDAS